MKKIILSLFLLFISNKVFANFDIDAETVILQDYLSGEILYEKDADLQIYPASITKIMTSIIAFDLLKKNELSLDDKFIVSENAWRLSSSGYSSMFIMVGDEVSVKDLLLGIIVASDYEMMIRLLYKNKCSSYYIKKTLVEMRNGGFSNQSYLNRLKANSEDVIAWKLNGLNPPLFLRILKPLRKLTQFLKRPNL